MTTPGQRLSAMRRFSFASLFAVLTLAGASASAQIRLSPYVSDGAVFQRQAPIPISGRVSTPGIEVEVTLGGARTLARADAHGRFAVDLPPHPAGGPYEMRVVAGGERVDLRDIYVGDVWLASGQSNMAWTVAQSDSTAEVVARADDPSIRELAVAQGFAAEPQRELPAASAWRPALPAFVREFSAVGYSFAEAIRPAAGVPVGILHASYGGSLLHAWLSEDMLGFDERDAPVPGQGLEQQPTLLYNAMVHPLHRFPITGVIWYQGESDGDTRARALDYGDRFGAMITAWRHAWGRPELPFYFVQLAPFSGPVSRATHARPVGVDRWPLVRDGQRQALGLSGTGMAITMDVGDVGIHPPTKGPVGRRLARHALVDLYGRSTVRSGPIARSARLLSGGRVEVEFEHLGGGLVAGPGGAVGGFSLAAAGGRHEWADAQIVGDRVVVSSPLVPDPRTVRYAWLYNPADADLANAAGLPASPFELTAGSPLGLSIRAARSEVPQGLTTVVAWTVVGASSARVNGQPVPFEGMRAVGVESGQTFSLNATPAGGGANQATSASVAAAPPVVPNAALGRPARASTVESCCGAELLPWFAVDGDAESRWGSAWGTGQGGSPRDPNTDGDPDDEWLDVDLEQTTDVTRVEVEWEGAFASAYGVETSFDGRDWTTAASVSEGDGGLDVFDFATPVPARFVRVRATERGTEYGYSIYELRAFGARSADQAPTVRLDAAGGNVTPPGTPLVVEADASDPEGAIAGVEIWVDGQRVETITAPPYRRAVSVPESGAAVVEAIAVDAAGRRVRSRPFEAVAMPREAAVYEAEDAATSGDGVAVRQDASASGGRYAELRDDWTIDFAVGADRDERVALRFRYRLPFGSPKSQHLVVNGDTLRTLTFTSDDPAAWRELAVVVPLRAGGNTVGLHGLWDRMALDHLAVVGGRGEVADEPEAVFETALLPVRPNPMAAVGEVAFTLATRAEVALEVFDATGRRVAVLADGPRDAGPHRAAVPAARLAGGVYAVRLRTPGAELSRRFVVVR